MSTIVEERPTDLGRAWTLVWIDAREAVLVDLDESGPHVERVTSDVPAHHRATGHVRHDPAIRHGGGRPQTSGEPRRIEYLARFVEEVAARLPTSHDLIVLGQGTVHEQLSRHLEETDRRHGYVRDIRCAAMPRRTDRQLIAYLREVEGEPLRRRTVGAYRWSEPVVTNASGQGSPGPRRMAKPRSRSGRSAVAEDGEGDGE
jgi:hypothetical protein